MKHFICAVLFITLVACDQFGLEKSSINGDKSDLSFTSHAMVQKAPLPLGVAASAMSNVLFKGILFNTTDIAINGKHKVFLCVLTFLIKRFFSTPSVSFSPSSIFPLNLTTTGSTSKYMTYMCKDIKLLFSEYSPIFLALSSNFFTGNLTIFNTN